MESDVLKLFTPGVRVAHLDPDTPETLGTVTPDPDTRRWIDVDPLGPVTVRIVWDDGDAGQYAADELTPAPAVHLAQVAGSRIILCTREERPTADRSTTLAALEDVTCPQCRTLGEQTRAVSQGRLERQRDTADRAAEQLATALQHLGDAAGQIRLLWLDSRGDDFDIDSTAYGDTVAHVETARRAGRAAERVLADYLLELSSLTEEGEDQ